MDLLFQDKKLPQNLSKYTLNLIETIGETKTKQYEEQIIIKQIKKVKQQIINKEITPQQQSDILIKLIYFETLGYDTSFAQILPINLCQSSNLYLKKIAYLLAAMLVKPNQKIGLLMNNTLLKDLLSDNIFCKLIALTMLRYFLNVDLAQTVLPIILKLLKNKTNIVKQKSLLILLNIYQINNTLIPNINEYIINGLNEKETPVIFTSINILKILMKKNPYQYKHLTQKLIKILTNIIEYKYPHQYSYHQLPCPWLQIQILEMLEWLGKNDQNNSLLMYDILSKTIRKANLSYITFSKAILQQCTKTICNIYPNQLLIQQCSATLEKFFQIRNHNLMYFGICCLIQITKVNLQSLQNWQMILMQCLESKDLTLAEKTISLLIKIANEQNTDIILNRIIILSQKSIDSIQKRNLIKQGIILIQKFSQNREIFLRRMNEIFYKFEYFITDTSINNFLKVLIEIVQMQQNFAQIAVNTYIEILLNFQNNVLLKVSCWIIGQFTHRIYLKNNNVEFVDKSINSLILCANQNLNDYNIIFILLSSLMKLSLVNMTTKHEQIKNLLLKIQLNSNYFIHKIGQEFIRMAKYNKALYNSNQINFNTNMLFLTQYINTNYKEPIYNFIISKKNYQKSNNYDFLSINEQENKEDNKKQQQKMNIFEFKPGNRWAISNKNNNQNNKKEDKQIQKNNNNQNNNNNNNNNSNSNKFTLRGPHQCKKNKVEIDPKKIQLAKSLFGKKNK